MNTHKLRDALAEMEAEQSALNDGIAAIRRIIASFETDTTAKAPLRIANKDAGQRSYIDDGEEVFQAVGKPLHIKDITARFSEMRGAPVNRASVESSFIRHIAKAVNPRLAKFGKSTFGLAAWKQPQPTLAQTA